MTGRRLVHRPDCWGFPEPPPPLAPGPHWGGASVVTWYAASVLGLPVYVILWPFLVYSFAGILVEGVFCLVLTGRLELRLGLLYLPLRPIYGLGGAASTLLLTPLLDYPVVVFALSVVICSAVELLCGWAVEEGIPSWDYSDKRLNLRGRICLQYSLCWGTASRGSVVWVPLPHGR